MISMNSGLIRKILGNRQGLLPAHTIPAVQDENVCFLVSAPRSGSTWIKKALNQHPNIFCTEQRLFGRFSEFWCDDVATREQKLRITLDAYVDALAVPFDYQSLKIDREIFKQIILVLFAQTLIAFGRERSGKGVVVDKITPYLGTAQTIIASIQTYFPKAKVIYLMRDGRDVAISGVFDWLKKTTRDGKFSQFQMQRYQKFVKKDANIRLNHFFEPEEIETWAHYWLEPLQYIQSYAGLTISYERMKQNLGQELHRLFHYLGVCDSNIIIENCLQASSFSKMSCGRDTGQEVATAKVRKGITGDWKNYFTRAEGEHFHNIAGKYLLDFGYETNEQWYEDLPVNRWL